MDLSYIILHAFAKNCMEKYSVVFEKCRFPSCALLVSDILYLTSCLHYICVDRIKKIDAHKYYKYR